MGTEAIKRACYELEMSMRWGGGVGVGQGRDGSEGAPEGQAIKQAWYELYVS